MQRAVAYSTKPQSDDDEEKGSGHKWEEIKGPVAEGKCLTIIYGNQYLDFEVTDDLKEVTASGLAQWLVWVAVLAAMNVPEAEVGARAIFTSSSFLSLLNFNCRVLFSRMALIAPLSSNSPTTSPSVASSQPPPHVLVRLVVGRQEWKKPVRPWPVSSCRRQSTADCLGPLSSAFR